MAIAETSATNGINDPAMRAVPPIDAARQSRAMPEAVIHIRPLTDTTIPHSPHMIANNPWAWSECG
jgi:hypothetical protein